MARYLNHFSLRTATVALGAFLMLAGMPTVAVAGPGQKGGGRAPARVEVAPVIEKTVRSRVTLVGTAEPWTETVVASETAGLVRQMRVDEGDRVRENQTLCAQDATQLKLKIEAARASVSEAEADKIRKEREWERQKRLYSIHSVSKKSYEDAQFEAKAAVNRVARLQVELYALLDQEKKKVVYAPVTGTVVKRHTLVGQWLGQGGPVVTLAVLDPIRVMVPVPERYITHIKRGDASEVVFDALPGQVFKGVVDTIIPRADGATRAFPVRIRIPNPETTLKAGMLGRATLAVGNPHKAVLVPKDALVLSGSGKSVFVINDRKAHRIDVKTGPACGGLVEVEGLLKPGQRVAVRGNERLAPDQPVTIINSK